MAANIRQKVVKLPNNAQLVTTLNTYMALGYVLHQMIVYYDPSVD